MTQALLSIEDLELLAAIGETASLSGGAKRLGLDHSSAFRRLGKLETRLGARLFDRSRSGYVPTPAGEFAIATVTRVLGDLRTLEQKLAGKDLRPSGIVRVTTTDTLLDFLGSAFASFREAHPEIIIETVVAMAFLTLTRRDADVAIRATDNPGDMLVGRRVADIAYAVYGSKRVFARLKPEHWNDAPWVGFDETLAHLAAAKWTNARVTRESVVHRANTLPAIQAAVRSGLGLAPLPCFMGDPDAQLVRIGAALPELRTPLWILTHPDLRRAARIRAFMDHAGNEIASRRSLLEGIPQGE